MTGHRLIIENLGPIKHVVMDVKDFTVLIGPQASGKSTIAKVVYLYNQCKSEFFNLAANATMDAQDDFITNPLEAFKRSIAANMSAIFENVHHRPGLLIEYHIKDEYEFKITPADQKYQWKIDFSETISHKLSNIVEKIKIFHNTNGESSSITEDPFLAALRKKFWIDLSSSIEEIFISSPVSSYIPAGRMIVSLFDDSNSSLLQSVSGHVTGLFSLHFHQYKTRNFNLNDDMQAGLAKEILNGDYEFSKNDSWIINKNQDYSVRMRNASSGQQEFLGILRMIQWANQTGKTHSFILEEPEAHLYPETQKKLMELAALFFNSNPANQLFITTHSPYILASLNNLLYAHGLGQKKPDEVAAVIPRELWLPSERMQAYFVDQGTVRDIMDQELGMIRSEEIDSASRIINQEYDRLFNLDDA